MGDEAFNARVGELRRLTIMFSDVVGSTELSGRQEPEAYRELMRGYRVTCRDVIESRFEGHIVQLKGDGTLSIFGFPVAHENDAERAVRAALALVRRVRELSVHAGTAAGETLEVRVAVHHGPVYVDFDEDDIYGLAANVAARLHAVAEPGTVIVSDEVRQLVDGSLRDRGRRTSDRQGRDRADRVVPRGARAQRSCAALMVDTVGGAGGRAATAAAVLDACRGR